MTFGIGYEGLYKLTHGGMNDMSPWRQATLNRMFPNDRTGVYGQKPKLGQPCTTDLWVIRMIVFIKSVIILIDLSGQKDLNHWKNLSLIKSNF